MVRSLALLDAVRAARVPRLIFSSTAAVYGNPVELPITESAVKAPTNTYGATKLTFDHALTSEAYAHGLAAVSLRYFNVAGAYIRDGARDRRAARPGDPPDPDRAAGGRRQAGEAAALRRRLPDRRRHLRARLHPRRRPGPGAPAGAGRGHRPGEHRIFNLGNGNGFSNRQVVEVVREVTGAELPVEIAPRREGDPATLVASARAARDELGWAPAEPTLHDDRRRLDVLPGRTDVTQAPTAHAR